MKFLLAASGPRGDTQPLMALGVGLQKAGHEVLMTAAPDFADDAKSFGLAFRPVGRSHAELMRDHPEMFASVGPLRMFHTHNLAGRDELRYQFEMLRPLADGVDVVVSSGGQLAAHAVAEAVGAEYRFIVYEPRTFVPSADYAPGWFNFLKFQLPPLGNRLAWAACEKYMQAVLFPELNRYRARLGLKPMESLFRGIFAPSKMILAVDAEIAGLPKDLAAPFPATGYWLVRDERPLPPELARFLDSGPAPIFIGFGSTADANPRETGSIMLEVIRRVGCRAVLSLDPQCTAGRDVPSSVFVCEGTINHWTLFPRVAGIVHHAGSGTIAVAMRAGIPQLSIPHLFDQHGHAREAHELGIGPAPIARQQLSVERLEAGMRALIGDVAAREKAAALGKQLLARDPIETAVSQLATIRPRTRASAA